MEFFSSALLKIRRANTHIAEIHSLLVKFSRTNLYDVAVEKDGGGATNILSFQINKSGFPSDDVALAIGDAVHNLRSALDHLYYRVVLRCGGTPTRRTQFPLCETRDSLTDVLKKAMNRKEISAPIVDLIWGRIGAHKDGNRLLWGLKNLSNYDKHRTLTPVLKLTGIWDVRIEDEKHNQMGESNYYISDSCRIEIPNAENRVVELTNKGHGMAFMIFEEGTPLKGQNVVNTLRSMADEARKTVEAFELLKPADYVIDGTPSRFLSA